jgi:signal transduction histidine kinase
VETFVNRKFFREKYEYQTTLRQAARVLAGIVELSPLLDQVLATVTDALKIERGLIILRDEDAAEWTIAAAQGYPTTPAPPPSNHPLLGFLETERRAVQLNELMELREFALEREAVIEPAIRLGLVLLVPISYERGLIGVLGLGLKLSGAWYSSEDIDLLSTLMVQTGVSIANARQVEKLKQMVALETSYRELQRLDEMKDSLLHMVSHDLRTPMTGILGYAYMLHEGVETLDPKSQREYLSVVIKEGERLTRLINDLLDLQRFEAGRMELEMEEIDLADLLDDAARVFTITMDNQGLRFEREASAGPLTVSGHKDRLEQVIANLLSNAIKYTGPGGAVTLRAERTAADGRGEIKVTVTDTGRGIAREFHDGVFDKFQQAQRRAAGPGEGSGLGLALVKEIIQYHRGRVGFESEPGRGSSFYFYLPEAEGGADG